MIVRYINIFLGTNIIFVVKILRWNFCKNSYIRIFFFFLLTIKIYILDYKTFLLIVKLLKFFQECSFAIDTYIALFGHPVYSALFCDVGRGRGSLCPVSASLGSTISMTESRVHSLNRYIKFDLNNERKKGKKDKERLDTTFDILSRTKIFTSEARIITRIYAQY